MNEFLPLTTLILWTKEVFTSDHVEAAQIFISKRTQLLHSVVHFVCTVWIIFGIAFEAASCPWIDLVTVFIATGDQFDFVTLVNYLQMQGIEVEAGIGISTKRRVILWKKKFRSPSIVSKISPKKIRALEKKTKWYWFENFSKNQKRTWILRAKKITFNFCNSVRPMLEIVMWSIRTIR